MDEVEIHDKPVSLTALSAIIEKHAAGASVQKGRAGAGGDRRRDWSQ